MSDAEETAPRKTTLAVAELDSFLLEAGPVTAFREHCDLVQGGTMEAQFLKGFRPQAQHFETSPQVSSSPLSTRHDAMCLVNACDEEAVMTETRVNAVDSEVSVAFSMLSPPHRDTLKCSEFCTGLASLEPRLRRPVDDDVSISASTIMSRDFTVHSKARLISNMEDVEKGDLNDILNRLTRRSPSSKECVPSVNSATRETCKDDPGSDSCLVSARSLESRALSRASVASKRSSRTNKSKRGPSLERDISICILQTAAGGADSAHFRILDEGCKEYVYCADAILQDLLMTTSPTSFPGTESLSSTRSIRSHFTRKSKKNRSDCTAGEANVGVKSIGSTETVHTTNRASCLEVHKDADGSASADDAVFAVDLPIMTDALNSSTSLACLSRSVDNEVNDFAELENLDSRRRDTERSASNSPVKAGSKISLRISDFNDAIRRDFEYHDTADDNGCVVAMTPATQGWEGSTAQNRSVVTDILDEECEQTVFDEPEIGSIKTESEGQHIDSGLDKAIACNHALEVPPQFSARTVILSFAEHVAHAYNLAPVKGPEEEDDDVCPCKDSTCDESKAYDKLEEQGDAKPISVESGKAEFVSTFYNVFETSRNGFGRVYAFEMDENDDWTEFPGSFVPSGSFSPSRQTVESSAGSDTCNTVYSAPLDSIKKAVLQPESPTSVVSMESRLAEI